MLLKGQKYLLSWASISMLLLGACAGDNDPAYSSNGNSEAINSITVSRAPRYAAPGVLEDPITVTQFDSESVIYISQMGTSLNPSFSSSATTNLYPYVYNDNEDASWDSDYNFEAQNDPILWSEIRKNGQVGNAFSLFGMYFPVDQEIRFNVESNQSELDDFQKSDILGAYHATPSLYSRLRFRFFHLMAYLRVTIYVPTEEAKPDNTGYTGFGPDALNDAYIINAITNFDVDWRANRSSDTEAPLINTAQNASRSNITMYEHERNSEVQTIDVTNYYNGGLTEDQVRAYTFSVLFPAQSFNGNIICFRLQTPGGQGENYVNYYFSSTQLLTGSTEFRFQQGTLQNLTLYLPRNANKTVVVGANILDWTDSSTGMTVIEQKDNE